MFTPDIFFEFICITVSFTYILQSLERMAKTVLLLYFFALLVTHVIVFQINPQLCIIADTFTSTVFIRCKDGKHVKGLFHSATAALAMTIFISIASNIENLILYKTLHYGEHWQILVRDLLILTFSITISVPFKKRFLKFKEQKSMVILSCYNLAILLLFYVGTPYYLKLDKETMAFVSLLLLLLFAGLGNLISSSLVNNIEQKRFETELWNEKYNAFKKEHEEIQKLKHILASRFHLFSYYLQQNDLDGLKKFYIENIEPIVSFTDNEQKTIAKIESIEDNAIKVSVFSLYNQCLIYGIPFAMEFGHIGSSHCQSMNDLLTILGIFIENTIFESVDLEGSFIKISVLQEEKKTVVTISNTYGDLRKEKNRLLYDKPVMEKRFGKGILLAGEISSRNDDLTICTWKCGNCFLQQVTIKN